MPTDKKKYSVTVGLSVRPEGQDTFADFGLRYGDMDLANVTGVEAVFDKHADAILTAMQPLRAELVAMGVALNPPDPEMVEKLKKAGQA